MQMHFRIVAAPMRALSYTVLRGFAKIDGNKGNFRERFRENAKSVIFTVYFIFSDHILCQIFFYKICLKM
jgi:hypothetical protein